MILLMHLEYYTIVSQSLLMVSLQKENSVSTAVTPPAFVHSSKAITSTSKLLDFLLNPYSFMIKLVTFS